MIDANLAAVVAGRTTGFQDIEIGEREPMVLVIISEKCQSGVLVNYVRFENIAVSCNHLNEAPGLVDDVRELHRLHHCCLP